MGNQQSKGMNYHVVVQTAFLGDLCLSVPLFKHIRRLWPDDRIVLVCRAGIGEIFGQLGLVDRVIEVQKSSQASYDAALEDLHNFRIKKVFVPHMSIRSALFASKIRSEQRIGFWRWWNVFFFSERLKRSEEIPDALRQLSLLVNFDFGLKEKFLLWETGSHFYKKSEKGHLVRPPEWSSMGVSSLINKTYPLEKCLAKTEGVVPDVLIFPGSVWATKRWTELGFTQVARALRQKGMNVFICGSPSESELCSRVARESQTNSIAGKLSLGELLRLMTSAKLVIGNDSGSNHLAAMAEVTSVSMFGPTILSQGYRPWSEKSWVVEMEGLGCRPCGKHGHKKCPLGTHECMKHISDEQVMAAVIDALNSPGFR